MDETKHTPGPWHVTECDGEYSINWPDCVGIKPFKDERRKANAYLIAAAPELLEALKLVIAELPKNNRYFSETGKGTLELYQNNGRVWSICRDAIIKAEAPQ